MFLRKFYVAVAVAVYLISIALFVHHQNHHENDAKTLDFHRFLSVCRNETYMRYSDNDEIFDRSDLNSWELFCCTWHSWISLVVSAVSAVLLVIVVISGFVSHSLENAKLSAIFVSGFLLIVCAPAICNFLGKCAFSLLVFDIGGVLTVLALTILCFDAWQFSAQETQSQVDRRNKYFKIFAAVFLTFSVSYALLMLAFEGVEVLNLLFHGFFLMLFAMLVADGVVLALAAVKARKGSRDAARSDDKTWKNQNERLVKYVQLLVITVIVLWINNSNFWLYKGYTTLIICDLVHLFSAFLLFAIFVLENKLNCKQTKLNATDITTTPE